MVSDQERARKAYVARMEELNLSRSELARRSNVALNTLRDFVDGRKWPMDRTMQALETAVGWPVGSIAYIAEGGDVPKGETPAETISDGDVSTTVGRPGGEASMTILLSPDWRKGLEDQDVELIKAQLLASAHEFARKIRLENEERERQRHRPPAE